MSGLRGRAVLVVIASGFLFGTTGTSVVLAGTGASPLSIAALRMLVGSLGLLAVASLQRDWRRILLLWRLRMTWFMGLGVAGYMVAFFASVQTGGVAIASLVSIALSPLFTAVFARFHGRPWPGLVWLLSTALAVIGVALLGTPMGGTGSANRLLGTLFAVVASAAYGSYTVFGAQLVARAHHATDALAASFSLGALVLLPLLFTSGSLLLNWRGLVLGLWLGLATTTMSYVMFGYGITHLAPGVVATLVLSEPLVATVLGVSVLGEHMPAQGWIGCALIGAGLILVARNETKGAPVV